MNDSIYDFSLEREAYQPPRPNHGRGEREAASMRETRSSSRRAGVKRLGLIVNPRSHRNQGRTALSRVPSDIIARAPKTRSELKDVLLMFADRKIDILAIDGGDGTVRDVLTCAGDIWGTDWPDVMLLPTGKTNALAGDLGVPSNWSLEDGLAAAQAGGIAVRRPLEIIPAGADGVPVRGFIMGVGSFVSATDLAQKTHRAGAFDGIAVGLALVWGIGQTLFGSGRSSWRRGSRMDIHYGDGADRMHGTTPDGSANRYLLLASTLERLPIGLKPFGMPRAGLKTLLIDAPPRRLAATFLPLLSGSQAEKLDDAGYHRVDARSLKLDIETSFVLDGETFPAGAFTVREATALRFIIP